jgi:Tol biopolymer transport system component
MLIIAFGCNTKQSENEIKSFPVLKGKYLGQNEPGHTPEIFAPNIVSTGMTEINACFSPDFSEFFYTIILPSRKYVIISMSYENDKWSEPEVANFSGKYSDADPFITKDGKWLYFVSKRPEDSAGSEKSDWDIWRIEKINGDWLNPERLENGINSESDDIYPTLSDNGTLYFSSGRDGKNNRDIFYSEVTGEKFNSPIKLNDTINGHWEGDLFISPKEDYLIFRSYGRAEGGGLFITFNKNNHWSIPIKMGEEINMTGNELCPIVSPDGKYFFFSSANTIKRTDTTEILTYQKIKENYIESYKNPQMGKTDIYWVSSEIIEKYRNKCR